MSRRVAIALSCACFAGGAAHADALQDQVVAIARATRTDTYSFRRTIVVESNLVARKVVEEQFDPHRPAGDQWVLLSIDARAPTPKEAADAYKARRDPFPPYPAVAKWFGGPAVRSETAPGYATYRFASLWPGTLKFGSHDASPDTQAEVLVNMKSNVPFIERIDMTSTKPFSMMLVASMRGMTFTMRYRQLADGNIVPLDAVSDITGSAMGKAGQAHTSATFSDFQPAQ